MTIRLNGQTSGYVELEAPAAAGSNTLTLPTSNGSSGQYLQTNGSGTLSWQTVSTIAVAPVIQNDTTLTNQSELEFTNIPADVKQITILFRNASLSGTDNFRVQLGTSSAYVTTGYEASAISNNDSGSGGGQSITSGLLVMAQNASLALSGRMDINKMGSDNYVSSYITRTNNQNATYGGSTVTLGGTLTRLRILPTGSNTMDGGRITLMYWG